MLNSFDIPTWKPTADIFVEPDWLHQNLDNPNVKILDGTWALPGTEGLTLGILPNTQFFDLDRLKNSTEFGVPYPFVSTMRQMASELGIKKDDHIIVYDRQGFFSAPRVAWSFLAIGHKTVSVLRGGLPQWVSQGYETLDSYTAPIETQFSTSPSLVKGVVMGDVLAAIESDIQIIDARSEGRFSGREPEPRPKLRSGHIPGSLNLPLSNLKNADGELLTGDALLDALAASAIDLNRPIITTCGSGVTAAALAFVFYALGKQDVAVYSGSWAEYGASDYPIET